MSSFFDGRFTKYLAQHKAGEIQLTNAELMIFPEWAAEERAILEKERRALSARLDRPVYVETVVTTYTTVTYVEKYR